MDVLNLNSIIPYCTYTNNSEQSWPTLLTSKDIYVAAIDVSVSKIVKRYVELNFDKTKFILLCKQKHIIVTKMSYASELLLNSWTEFYGIFCVCLSRSLDGLISIRPGGLTRSGVQTRILRFRKEKENFICL